MKKGNNIMKVLKLIGVLAVITSLAACGRKAKTGIPDSWESLIEEDYSISYPGDWKLDQSGDSGTNFVLFSPDSSAQGVSSENIYLVSRDWTGLNLNLDLYMEVVDSRFRDKTGDIKVLENKRITTEELDYQRIIYIKKEGIRNLKFEQYHWVVGDTVYVLSFTREESLFDNYQTVGAKIRNSFSLNVENKTETRSIDSLPPLRGTVGNKTETRIPGSWKSFAQNNYSISYPGDWELNNSGLMGTSLILLSPISSGQDQFRENINLLVHDLTGFNFDLYEYAEASESQIKAVTTDARILESRIITATEAPDYYKIIYTGKQGIHNLKFEQYIWVVEDKAYILTLSCEEHQFDYYQTTGEQILNSFSFF
ncbi:hypothetical protein P0082_03900 [Candidatus Haliotispira prima]|uniref:PsbP C-terminal domain-containing protein n=1 Tax=Candidatus Haliotispira prima TaxID=3034016 RepID=A0ABY8MJ72_9SPIO|nr:hypothetical protein P0082_03900 [Candidatus Haliotispira prima]